MIDLDELERARAATTPGDWQGRARADRLGVVSLGDNYHAVIGDFGYDLGPHAPSIANIDFIVLAHRHMPELIAELRKARADYAAIAHALGIEYVPEQGPTAPGPIGAVLQEIRDNAQRRDDLEERLAAIAEVPCVKRWGKHPMKCFPKDRCTFCRVRELLDR